MQGSQRRGRSHALSLSNFWETVQNPDIIDEAFTVYIDQGKCSGRGILTFEISPWEVVFDRLSTHSME